MLDPHPRAQLCFVIKQYGQVIITEPKRCKGMLSDLAPHHRLEINLLIAALEQKVAQELLKPTALIPVAMQLERLAQRLHDTVGIKEDFAYWAVESWALALNVIQQPIPKQTVQSIENVSLPPVQLMPKPQPMPAPKVAVTPPPAQKQTPTDAWLGELIAWADENNIPDYYFDKNRSNSWRGFPRDKQTILALTELNLWGDQFTELPESIGKLTNLTKLSLSRNQLTELPEWIGKLTNLTRLDLIRNQLTKLPESIGKLTNLTKLYLSYNQLTELPESIGKLSNLKTLDLGSNQLTELPESIGKLTNLTWLNLSNNPIKSLPPKLSHLHNITSFDKPYY
ncbi:MAG: leucine-rich repeat domain-containing protein [Methylococcales bacterium]